MYMGNDKLTVAGRFFMYTRKRQSVVTGFVKTLITHAQYSLVLIFVMTIVELSLLSVLWGPILLICI